jgi:hypothetical protein
MGINFYILPKEDVNRGIYTVKEKFSLVYFDEKKCELGLEALKAYRREWDELKLMFTEKPLHDWASDPADAFRMWAMAPEPALPNDNPSDFGLYSQSYR